MYLKVKTSDKSNGWRMYEAHELQWHYGREEDWQLKDVEVTAAGVQEVVNEWFRRITEAATKEEEEDRKAFVCISFWDEADTPRNVYTNLPAFLLNNDGKTMERIN
jgi:hypothetical protein